jgi:predicted component of type VI protein secretion system
LVAVPVLSGGFIRFYAAEFMPILIIESRGTRKAGTLNGRVLIGRWPNTTLTIDDRAVSRIHAWIGLQDGHYYVADAGSRTGTFVNNEPLHDRYFLADGDQIRIGPALLQYHIDAVPPADIDPIDLTPRMLGSKDRGTFMDCACGAPLWLPQHFSGVGRCRYCGRKVRSSANGVSSDPPKMPIPPPLPPFMRQRTDETEVVEPPRFSEPEPAAADFDAIDSAEIPQVSPVVEADAQSQPFNLMSPGAEAHETASERAEEIPTFAGPVAPAASSTPPTPSPTAPKPQHPKRECGVCHSQITRFDETTVCPSCGLAFHHDCWQENQGCSAYGCAQVGALAPQLRHA